MKFKMSKNVDGGVQFGRVDDEPAVSRHFTKTDALRAARVALGEEFKRANVYHDGLVWICEISNKPSTAERLQAAYDSVIQHKICKGIHDDGCMIRILFTDDVAEDGVQIAYGITTSKIDAFMRIHAYMESLV